MHGLETAPTGPRLTAPTPTIASSPNFPVDWRRKKSESTQMPPTTPHSTTQHTPPQPSRLQNLLRKLDRELTPELQGTIQRANRARNDSARKSVGYPSGLAEIDELIGGGFPVGCLSEISGPISSGRTSLVLALLAGATRNGAHVAWVEVDCAEAFDPPSADAAGVVLERVLWVRARHPLAALRCTERILETEGFALVVLDLTRRVRARNSKRDQKGRTTSIPRAAWLRLTRLVAGKQNTLILLSDERLAGSRAALALEMQPAIAHFTGTPALLESLETHALLTRRRPGHSKAPSRAA